ncbi:hypothetical protein CALCODRAFT_506684 [Calocera cornea HHB12733]|uniref:Uncharacterized protein n=1 Tax=Calocera cornea HHB12733 TaxID=1353952 RepID=A0A165IPF7_9BASI|nr:hypothetical protein CALCODRAFT_506684 [Calocera cornea HHB12733]
MLRTVRSRTSEKKEGSINDIRRTVSGTACWFAVKKFIAESVIHPLSNLVDVPYFSSVLDRRYYHVQMVEMVPRQLVSESCCHKQSKVDGSVVEQVSPIHPHWGAVGGAGVSSGGEVTLFLRFDSDSKAPGCKPPPPLPATSTSYWPPKDQMHENPKDDSYSLIKGIDPGWPSKCGPGGFRSSPLHEPFYRLRTARELLEAIVRDVGQSPRVHLVRERCSPEDYGGFQLAPVDLVHYRTGIWRRRRHQQAQVNHVGKEISGIRACCDGDAFQWRRATIPDDAVGRLQTMRLRPEPCRYPEPCHSERSKLSKTTDEGVESGSVDVPFTLEDERLERGSIMMRPLTDDVQPVA